MRIWIFNLILRSSGEVLPIYTIGNLDKVGRLKKRNIIFWNRVNVYKIQLKQSLFKYIRGSVYVYSDFGENLLDISVFRQHGH